MVEVHRLTAERKGVATSAGALRLRAVCSWVDARGGQAQRGNWATVCSSLRRTDSSSRLVFSKSRCTCLRPQCYLITTLGVRHGHDRRFEAAALKTAKLSQMQGMPQTAPKGERGHIVAGRMVLIDSSVSLRSAIGKGKERNVQTASPGATLAAPMSGTPTAGNIDCPLPQAAATSLNTYSVRHQHFPRLLAQQQARACSRSSLMSLHFRRGVRDHMRADPSRPSMRVPLRERKKRKPHCIPALMERTLVGSNLCGAGEAVKTNLPCTVN